MRSLQARGEREATQGEKVSGFGEKPLGFYDTSHVIRQESVSAAAVPLPAMAATE